MRALDNIVKIDDKSIEYPARLREIPNPPKQLYCLGDISLLQEKSIAVVGSRKFTVYGKCVAQMIGKKFAQCGVPVVSGLANGIDSFAHQGMMEVKGKGIGVLGSGIKQMGPRRNYNLMLDMIDAGGLVVSEYEPDEPANKATFPQRNRIISGISEAVVVVEANFNSGALITAQFANSQGRTVFAVPGNINSQFSMGSNLLIRDGAIPLIVVDDALKEMGIVKRKEEIPTIECGKDELEIVDVMVKHNGITVDNIATEVNRRVGEVNAILTVMEIKGIVQSNCGKFYLNQNCV